MQKTYSTVQSIRKYDMYTEKLEDLFWLLEAISGVSQTMTYTN